MTLLINPYLQKQIYPFFFKEKKNYDIRPKKKKKRKEKEKEKKLHRTRKT